MQSPEEFLTPLNQYPFNNDLKFSKVLTGPELDKLSKRGHGHRLPGFHWPFVLRVPATFFGIALGMSSQAVVWKNPITGVVGKYINYVLWVLAFIFWAATTLIYCIKTYFYRGGVLRELRHPIRSNFLFMPFFTLSLLYIGLPDTFRDVVSADTLQPLVFLLGAGQLLLSVHIYSNWILSEHLTLRESNPTFQIATVGNFVTATMMARYGDIQFAMLFFSMGIVFWPVVLITLFQHMSRGKKSKEIWRFPSHLHPTLFLFMAPPSAACGAWVELSNGQFDRLASALFYFALFMFFIMLRNYKIFFLKTPFKISLWAYTFPSGAISIAAATWHKSVDSDFSLFLNWLLLIVSAGLLGFVVLWTINEFAMGRLFEQDDVMAVCLEKHPDYQPLRAARTDEAKAHKNETCQIQFNHSNEATEVDEINNPKSSSSNLSELESSVCSSSTVGSSSKHNSSASLAEMMNDSAHRAVSSTV